MPNAAERRKARRQARKERRRANRKKNQTPAPASTGPQEPKLNPQLGDFNPNEWDQRMKDIYGTVTDPTWLDVTSNPHLQAIAAQIDSDANLKQFRDMNAISSDAEGAGRFGSGVWQGLAGTALGEIENRRSTAKAGLYGSALENQKNRLAGLFNDVGGYNTGMLGIDVGYENAEANKAQAQASMVGARASMKNARTSAQALQFQKKMEIQAAQQDALNDYYNILAGIGGWGGTVQTNGSGSYQGSMDPWLAALMGIGGAAIQNQNSGSGQGGDGDGGITGGSGFGGGGAPSFTGGEYGWLNDLFGNAGPYDEFGWGNGPGTIDYINNAGGPPTSYEYNPFDYSTDLSFN